MKGPLARAALLAALLCASLAPAQPPVSLYGGVFRPGQSVRVGVDAPARTELSLERVLDPLAVFGATRDPHEPRLPPGTKTSVVRTLRTGGRSYGEVDLGRLSPGLYVLRAGRAGTLILVSDLGLVVKRDPNAALVYAADRGSGATRAARVWRLGPGGASALANPDGLAKFSVPARDGEFFLGRFRNQWAVSGASWNSYAAPRVRGFVYTDRPVYRPGQHVEFKGTVRSGGTLKPLTGRPVRVTVFSPFDESVYQKNLTTNGYGSFGAGFDLPAGARPGEYRFEARVSGGDDSDVGGTFAVEAYQKPEYAVTVTPGKTRAVQGDKLSVKVSARYLFGGSVGGARVTYNVTRAPYYPPGFDTEDLPPDPDGSDYGSDLVVQGETRLNAGGDLELTLPLERDAQGRPLSYRVEAEVEDESRRPVSGFARVLAFPASVNVEARTDAYLYDAGKPIRVELDTRDLGGRGRAAPVTLDLVRQEWVRVRGESTLRETRVSRVTARTNARGAGAATLTAGRGGGYLVRATVRDERGRASTAENFAWVLSPGEDWGWNYRDLTVRPDRRSYAPGDTVTVLVGNPRPGAPVLVTLEGDRLRRSTVLRGRGAALTYSFRVAPDMTGDVFVGAAALGDGNFYSSAARVRVPVRGAGLSVQVTPARAKYRPGETGRLAVQVRDGAGRGVPAELTFGVVDQAIYLVRPDASPTMLSVFHAPRENVVGTESSVSFYFETGRLAAPAPAMSEAAFAQNKSDRSAQADTPREDFRDTILWVPNLVTDASGRAELSVRFPDNLTTWVATARAQTVSARFGQSTATTVTTKDVVARLSLPPFLVRGDTVTLAGVVNNTLAQAAKGRVTAGVQGLTPTTPGGPFSAAGSPVSVAAGGRVRQDFDVRADAVGTARVTFGVRTGNAGDSLRLPLPVKARGYETSLTAAGGSGETVTLRVPPETNLGTARLRVFVTPSLLDAVTPALAYLVGYPYGCTEQTMSRFLPALLAREALGPGALPDDVRRDLPKITDLGLARLYDFQHDDGGWGFWQYDDSTLEMTAYVTRGLLRARALGVRADNGVLDRGLVYLARHVEDGKEPQGARATAYRALAEAGRVNAARLAAFAGRSELAPYALAHTALALSRAGQAGAARDVLDRLKARRVEGQRGALVHWDAPRRGDWLWYWEDNSIQTTAAALEALARLEPGSPLVPRTSQWLLANRRGPRWLSTQDTTSVVVAALALKRPAGQPVPAGVSLGGRTLGTVTGAGDLTLTGAALGLTRGANTLRVGGARGGSFSAELTFAREPRALPGDASRGFALTRTFERLVPTWNAGEKRYTYARTPLLRGGRLQPVTVGDLILVTLTVRPQEERARYLLVSDPVPAGMRALDDRSLAVSGLNTVDEDDPFAWNLWYAGRDLLDDRVDLYADYLGGTGRMTYVLRAQTPGTFTALPTHAFLMYDPDVEGYGPAATLTVRDRGR